jgi:threonine/homoserine/homoserine lactone efflux protein
MEAAVVAAVGIALSPIPMLATAAFLAGPRPRETATAFLSGEALAVVAVVGLVVGFTSSQLDDATLDRAAGSLELVVAALLAALLVSYLVSGRNRTTSARVLEAVDRAGVGIAFVSGVAVIVANPKNLALALAGAGAIVELQQPGGVDALSVMAFTLLAISGLLAMTVAYAVVPDRAAGLLGGVRGFIHRNERVVVTATLLLLSVFFLARGLGDVTS